VLLSLYVPIELMPQTSPHLAQRSFASPAGQLAFDLIV